jgi:hypothetical protein
VSSYRSFDPFQIFKASKTPSGLYPRKGWLNDGWAQNPLFSNLFEAAAYRLRGKERKQKGEI